MAAKKLVCFECGENYTGYQSNRKYCPKCKVERSKVAHLKSRGKYKQGIRNNYIIFERDLFRCIYCGKSSIEDGVKLNVDHIDPRKNGGLSNAENLVTSCLSCNCSKGACGFDLETIHRVLMVVGKRNKEKGISGDLEIKP